MKLSQAISLAEALDTILSVVNANLFNARFHASPDGGLNAAGRKINALSEMVCGLYLDALDDVRAGKPTDELINRNRKRILACHDLDNDDDALDLVSKFTERN
ncbi:hypothetical protein AXW83_21060 [Bosea sp. PAMC 26642]|nr:hypothetical protein AXW83_21060 [Bosea sp. PAMC 26642]